MIRIIYRDERLVAVYKPAGLLMHRSPESRDTRFLLQLLRDQIGQRVYPVHRLDRGTAGIVLFALSLAESASMQKLFSERRVQKTYQCVVRGFVTAGEIDYPLTREDGAPPQEAQTRFKDLQKFELPIPIHPHPTSRYSLVEVQPSTGRRHQIRRHFAHIRHPLIGDTAHGDGRHNRFFRAQFGSHRLLLLATRLRFDQADGSLMDLQAEPDDEWLAMVNALSAYAVSSSSTT